MRRAIRAELELITPFDEMESSHLTQALAWVDSDTELCRIAKPATPPIHLVSYFAVLDGDHILLVDHKNANLWLPTGGHVEQNEHPRETVARELKEELGMDIAQSAVGAPVMLTSSETVGLTAGHTDISLWYVIRGSRLTPLTFDESEFNAVNWFCFSEVPLFRADPNLGRFLRKLEHQC
jgi:ADP-ribose pyrophosphatase YjhB (NUDIX family)